VRGPDSGDGGHDLVFALERFKIIGGMLKGSKRKFVCHEGRVRVIDCVNKELLIPIDYFRFADLVPMSRRLGNGAGQYTMIPRDCCAVIAISVLPM